MRSSVIQPAKWTVLFLIAVFLSDYSYAVSKEEWQQLNLFYGEEDLVITSTRHPKHISQVPENMEVVTSEEIEKMNVHTVAEVLERVTGVFVEYASGRDYGSSAWIKIQGSGTQMHVKLMIDGIIKNNHSEGFPSLLNLPLGIVDRIEIIKGPASSTWGSALGGVINIITKNPVRDKSFKGEIRSSYGKENSQDHSVELTGRNDSFGYYLYSNYQESDGLVETRSYENQNYFTKLQISPFKSTDIILSSGLSYPEIIDGTNFGGYLYPYEIPTNWFVANLVTSLDDLTVQLNLSQIRQKTIKYELNSTTGERTKTKTYDEKAFVAKGQGAYEFGDNTFVIGFDKIIPAELDYSDSGGNRHEEIEKTAFYTNTTINVDNFTIVPGLRFDEYDYEKMDTRNFLSPSLGVVYRFNSDTIFRGTITKGFNEVPIDWLSVDSGYGNPDVENEEVLSYQTGFETRSISFIWFKTTLFYNELKNKIPLEGNVENIGNIDSYGCELEIRTLKIYNFIFSTGISYVKSQADYISGKEDDEAEDTAKRCTLNFGIVYEKKEPYENSEFLRISLNGRYINWDREDSNEEHDDFIIDLDISKRININGYGTEFYIKANNLFNGEQYLDDNENPEFWLDCGIKIFF